MNRVKLINLFKEQLLKEYSEKIIRELITKFKKENKDITENDIRAALTRFDQIKSNIFKRINSKENIEKGVANLIIMPPKFTEKDPKTGKGPLNPTDILNYTWKDLEYLLDAYGSKETKISKDTYTVQEAELVKITGVPIVYNTPELKIYEGSNYENCIKLNYAFKYKDESDKIYSYEFCIGRKEEYANRYYPYRFGSGGKGAMYRSFYFVADPTQSAKIKGNASSRENFINWYHFFIIHCFENGKFGITDAVNLYGSEHELDGKGFGVEWEEIGNFMIKYGKESGKKAWDKIKNLKDVFKYVSPSQEEVDKALVRDQILNFEAFQKLTRNQKALYIGKRADQPNAFTPQMFNSLDIELKNLALQSGNGYNATYEELKNSKGLSRSYARFRFSRGITQFKEKGFFSTVLPLPFVSYLTDEEKKQYLEIFKNKLSATNIEKYFGEKYAKEWVQDHLKKLEYIEPKMRKYITSPKVRQLYNVVDKLYDNWVIPNQEEANYEGVSSAADQEVIPVGLYNNQWNELSTQEKQIILNLVSRIETKNKSSKYQMFLIAAPYIIKDGNKTYILLLNNKSNIEDANLKWDLIDAFSGETVKSNIDGDEYKLGSEYLNSPYPYNSLQRIYDIEDLKEI